MNVRKAMWLVLVVFGCGVSMPAWAVEQPASTTGSPAALPPAQMAMVEGVVAKLDVQSAEPSVQVRAGDGMTWTLALDPQTISVWKDGQLSDTAALKVGDRVMVRYMMKDGVKWAKSIRVSQAAAPSSAAPMSAPMTGSPATTEDGAKTSY